MPEEPEAPDQTPDAENPPPEEPVAPDEPAGENAGAEAQGVEESHPPETPEESEEIQPVLEAQPAEEPAAAAPADIDRLVEEQVLAQKSEAKAQDVPGEQSAADIREPEMDFPQGDAPSPTAQPVEFPQLKESPSSAGSRNLEMLMDVRLPVSIELGRTTLPIADILALGSGSIVELDKLAGEPVDLMVNNKIVAQGEVVVVDENFGIRITHLISPQERIKSL